MSNWNRAKLEELICDYMGVEKMTPLLTKHINELVLTYGMTFKEIGRCLCWYVEVNKGKLAVQYGIKTVCTSVREKADKYFKQLELDQQGQRGEAAKVVEYQENNIIFHISSLTNKKRQPKQLNINDINVKGDEDGSN